MVIITLSTNIGGFTDVSISTVSNGPQGGGYSIKRIY